MRTPRAGWRAPGAGHGEDQADVLGALVQPVHDFRGTYNVRDYRWFNLRYPQTGHDEKPAFDAYGELVTLYTAPG